MRTQLRLSAATKTPVPSVSEMAPRPRAVAHGDAGRGPCGRLARQGWGGPQTSRGPRRSTVGLPPPAMPESPMLRCAWQFGIGACTAVTLLSGARWHCVGGTMCLPLRTKVGSGVWRAEGNHFAEQIAIHRRDSRRFPFLVPCCAARPVPPSVPIPRPSALLMGRVWARCMLGYDPEAALLSRLRAVMAPKAPALRVNRSRRTRKVDTCDRRGLRNA